MRQPIASYLAIGGLLLTLGGCNTVEPSGGKMAADKSLYDRLGGETGDHRRRRGFRRTGRRRQPHQRQIRHRQYSPPQNAAGRTNLPSLRRPLHLHRP